MKRLIPVLLLSVFLLIGCQKKDPNGPTPPQPNPVPVVPVNPTPVPAPQSITEVENGKTFAVKKGAVLTFTLKTNVSEEYFWAFEKLDGDFEVLTDVRRGTVQTLTVKVNSSGSIGLQHCQFAPDGARVLARLAFGVQVNYPAPKGAGLGIPTLSTLE